MTQAKTDARDVFIIAGHLLIRLARRRRDVLHTMLKTKQPYRDSPTVTAIAP
ncbi:hypothetical protein [Nocardia seriolae]|uniref:hypothetical protein n=1 Tax=Nocardia seriolae TaxID=37332 RepID=UPI0011946B98|nr:hypothetical protein [Nocardia seriolae]MTJ62408.1 hypothetical protein [Nocardia seriolae]MTJ76505.1 hypothetical protein [Nocardia seriolae]MTJ87312.1 hypothetical protein [Nocardia seriolae]MTK31306.1 hypothetical protein [Nocardia seriolae]MTK41727.1 hypothetical protein [Nocardia seriolae]